MNMKKILCIVAAVILAAGIGVVAYLNSNKETATNDDAAGVISVENYIKQDKVHMDSISQNYEWFETCIKMTGEVDTLEIPTLEMVTNVFEVKTKTDSGLVSKVYGGKHYKGMSWFDTTDGLWLEDCNLMEFSDSLITFDQAFKRLQEADCVKPKSAYCTLRKQVGPHPTNPQWIFGNDNRGVVFVDAITGEVRTTNPVFDKNSNASAVLSDSILNFLFKTNK